MNETLQLIHRRRSLRRYADHPIGSEEINRIIQAAMRAPTAGNMMLYSILQVDDEAKKQTIAETCGHSFVADAPLVLLFLADMQRWVDLFEADDVPCKLRGSGDAYRTPDPSKLLMACCDAMVAAQNSVIAAESLGIGSCYIGDVLGHAEDHRELFGLPPYTFPITLVCYGYPPDGFEPRYSDRFETRFIRHRNRYRRFSVDELHEMLSRITDKFSGVLQERKMSLAEMTYRGFMNGRSAREQQRSVEVLLKPWQSV